MEKFAAANLNEGDILLVVRVELVDSVPALWCQLEIFGSLAPNQIHQVHAALRWEGAHLYRPHRRTHDRSTVAKFARVPWHVHVFS